MVAFKATKALVLFCCIADIFLLSDASDTGELILCGRVRLSIRRHFELTTTTYSWNSHSLFRTCTHISDRQCGNSSDYQRDIAAKSGEQLRFGNCTTLLAKDSVEKMELWVHIPPKLTHYRLFACENNCTERKDGFKEVNLSENVTVTFSVTFPKSLEGHVKICGEVTISQAFPDQPKCYQLLLKYVPYRGYQQQISTLFNILFEGKPFIMLCNLKQSVKNYIVTT